MIEDTMREKVLDIIDEVVDGFILKVDAADAILALFEEERRALEGLIAAERRASRERLDGAVEATGRAEAAEAQLSEVVTPDNAEQLEWCDGNVPLMRGSPRLPDFIGWLHNQVSAAEARCVSLEADRSAIVAERDRYHDDLNNWRSHCMAETNRCAKLEDALKPFAQMMLPKSRDGEHVTTCMSVDCFRAARAALAARGNVDGN